MLLCQRITRLSFLLAILSFLSITTPIASGYQYNGNLFDFLRNRSRTQHNDPQQQQEPDPKKKKQNSNNNEPIMKAWHCHGRSQRELVDRLRQANIVQSPAVQQVMELVDRKYYTADGGNSDPYMDAPQGIYKSQTISAPHMHAHVLEEMLPTLQRNGQDKPETGVKVLDVGCGSGYLTACLGRWFQPAPATSAACTNDDERDDHALGGIAGSPQQPILPFPGKVYGMDIHKELVQFTAQNIQKHDGDLLTSKTVSLQHGNGWLGWPEEAPFDAIHVGAAAASFPTRLASQLALHGVLIVPVGPLGDVQTLLKVERVAERGGLDQGGGSESDDSAFVWEDYRVTQLLGVRYVPLVARPE